MAAEQAEKAKKQTVRTLATEINISHDTLIDFLQKKGYTNVKSIMSKIDDDALDLVMKQFGKDKDVTDKRQKKIAAFKVQRSKTKGDEVPAAPTKPGAKPAADKSAPAAPKPVEELPEPITVEAPPEPVVELPEPEPVAEPEPIEAEVAEPVEEAQEPIVAGEAEGDEGGEDAEGPEEEEHRGGKRKRRRRKATTVVMTGSPTGGEIALPGLKIKGKIDLKGLEPQKKVVDAPKPKLKHQQQNRPPAPGQGPKTGNRPGDINIRKLTDTDDSKKKKGKERFTIDKEDVRKAVRRTLTGSDDNRGFAGRAKARKLRRRERAETEERRTQEEATRESTIIRPTEFVTAAELANLMRVEVGEIITKCIGLGLMVSINQRLDKDTIQLVADEFGYTVEFQEEFTTDVLEDIPDPEETLMPRPPVVTIMGHVDHGKTSLLDYIRKSNVVAGESGGITQHIGAYEVTLDTGRQISFLDTPGHEAFTAMRARGAQVTDIVILVIAADDSVMPQTWEAISHATAAGVPIVIALNKIDRPEANADRIRQQLADKNILVEEWGGKYGCVEVSAKKGLNVDKLLDRVLLEADILDLKANPNRTARGVIVEAEVDRGRGIQATVLVQKGTLRLGDPFIAGMYSGRVRAMFDERGNKMDEAPPSRPVQLLGFDGIPQAGDQFIVLESDSQAKAVALTRQQLRREQSFKQVRGVLSLDDISREIKEGSVQNLSIILKGDVDGSVEALADSLLRLSTSEVKVQIVHRAVGAITENDVRLAAASGGIIVGFHVRPNLDARKLAAAEHVDIRLYNVIYDCINEIRSALEGMLAPETKEEVTATILVRDTFKVPKAGTIAGCYVQDGKITRNTRVRLIRDGVDIFTGNISSLKRFKDDVREVDAGYECGIGLENFNDIKTGDVIEGFKIVEIQRKLEKTA